MLGTKLRVLFVLLLVCSFGILLYGGHIINDTKPPIPSVVAGPTGEPLFTGDDIRNGQNVYFARGGMHIGTIWGHGSYLAPDWSADYLHRMGLFLAARELGKTPEEAAAFTQKDFDALDGVTRGRLSTQVREEIKPNRYQARHDRLLFTANQAEAHQALTGYYTTLFRDGADRMGIQPGVVRDAGEGKQIAGFFAWLAWAAGTLRPDKDYTYTSNWPYDPLVGNGPTPGSVIWSIVSVILLLFFIVAALFVYLLFIHENNAADCKLLLFSEPTPTPSQKATLLFFITAVALLLVQIAAGAVTAHFTVEGTHFFGIPLAKAMPYAAARTWHLQLAIFFIAACFLGAGLFVGPWVGHEPKHQAPLVIALFAAVVVVVLGTLGGTWASVTGHLRESWYWLGHQGYEYIELGRVWQYLLIVGMIVWLALVTRAILPALRAETDRLGLAHMLLYSTICIPLFYMSSLLYGKGSHLANAEYWRWWVVHLWVEGFFEVFATVIMAFLTSQIGAVNRRVALTTVYFSIFLYLGSGVVGTFHHLYWTGSPSPIIALGAVYSALEVVPLSLLAFEVIRNLKVLQLAGWNYPYKWPLYFFISVAFWNILGAGIFGFMINPPIVLYYIQGMNTTPIHSHTALFGVYGLLSVSLMLFAVRNIFRIAAWSDKMLKWSFWLLNGGLLGMVVFSLGPSGFYQFYFAVKYGVWYARSPEVTSGPFLRSIAWLRIPPDLVFAAGAIVLFAFLARGAWLTFVTKVAPVAGQAHWQPPAPAPAATPAESVAAKETVTA